MRCNNFKNGRESKLDDESSKYKYKCSCGHSVVIYPFEHIERKLCDWCGYYVYTDAEEQKKYDFKTKIKEKMRNGRD